MALPITAFYAGLAGLWLAWLTMSVVRLRRRHRVSLGDGGRDDLAHAVRAHGNAAETLPLGLILLGLAEGLGTPALLLHLAALVLLAGRVVHAGFFLRPGRDMRLRVAGMVMTVSALVFLSLGLVAHGLWDLLGGRLA